MYQNIFSLKNKFALITGGTGGLGFEIAQAFSEMGATVAITGRNFNDEHKKFLCINANILNEDEILNLSEVIKNNFGTLNILVNCAGKNILKPAEDYDSENFNDVMNLNINALHNVTRIIGKNFFIPNEYGKILNLSSVKSLIGTDKNYIAYCASKGALNMYTRQLACEWGKYNINVNAIAPTFVRTNINAFQLDDPEFKNKLISRIPLNRIGQKSDVACSAVFLCSDAASFITGQILFIDGGLTAMQ